MDLQHQRACWLVEASLTSTAHCFWWGLGIKLFRTPWSLYPSNMQSSFALKTLACAPLATAICYSLLPPPASLHRSFKHDIGTTLFWLWLLGLTCVPWCLVFLHSLLILQLSTAHQNLLSCGLHLLKGALMLQWPSKELTLNTSALSHYDDGIWSLTDLLRYFYQSKGVPKAAEKSPWSSCLHVLFHSSTCGMTSPPFIPVLSAPRQCRFLLAKQMFPVILQFSCTLNQLPV